MGRRITSKDIIPSSLSPDRTTVVTTKGREYVFVDYVGRKKGNYHFVRREKLLPTQVIIPVPERFGVMENTFSGIPILCKLERLNKLIKKNQST